MTSLTWAAALAWRMRRQRLDPVAAGSAADVVRTLGAVASQLAPSWAELGLRTRRETSSAGDVERALGRGELVATFAFRGAAHWMTPDLAGVHLALRAAGRMWERPGWQSHYGLAPRDWPALREVVRDALADRPLTRPELAAVVTREPRFAHLEAAFTDPSLTFVKPFAWQGDLSLGPSRDDRMTLSRLDSNPAWTGLPDLDDAGRRAVTTYLGAYGPASPDNLHYWLGEGLGTGRRLVRRWLEDLDDQVATVDVEGEPRLVLRTDLDELSRSRPTDCVRLLPRYDQWVMGAGTADAHVVPPPLRPEVSRGANLLVVAGVVAGTWSLRGDTVAVHAREGGPAAPPDRLDAEVERLSPILGRPLQRGEHPGR